MRDKETLLNFIHKEKVFNVYSVMDILKCSYSSAYHKLKHLESINLIEKDEKNFKLVEQKPILEEDKV